MSRESLLLMSDSERDANMLYAVGMFVTDPFIYLRMHGKCHIVMNDLEIDRARDQARKCRVISLTDCLETLRQEGVQRPASAQVIRLLLQTNRLKTVFVPENFPLGLARELSRLKIKVEVKPGPFFPERFCKSAEEIKKMSAALIMAEVGLAEGIQAIKSAKIDRKGRLIYHGVPLTSEKVRAIIDTVVLQAGGLAAHTIVAGGRQGCDPHASGQGILRANEPIIIDVFPRSQKTGYYGDITRTVVRGRASEGVRKAYATVGRAQELALGRLRKKLPAREVHQTVQDYFNREGYRTGNRNGRMQGFFHSSGHGLGLEIHEPPSLSAASNDLLLTGQVVTVEPGLYYSELGGGVRLEDMALITNNGPRNLTQFEKVLEV